MYICIQSVTNINKTLGAVTVFICKIMEYEHERQSTAFDINGVLCSGKHSNRQGFVLLRLTDSKHCNSNGDI